MLDLILFSSCVVVTKFMSQQGGISSSPLVSSSSAESIHKIPSSDHQAEGFSSMNFRPERPAMASEPSVFYWSAHAIYQITLLLSLSLFCLSILEAAPASWLLFMHQTSTFVQCYRAILWALCIVLEIAIPILLGVMLVVKLSGYEAIAASSTSSPAVSPPKATKSPRNKSERSDRHKLMVVLQVAWLSIRFCFAAIWYILKRILSIFLPSTFITECQTGTIYGKDRCRTSGELCNSRSMKQYFSPRVALPIMFALTISFWMLGTLSIIVISDTSNAYIKGESADTHQKQKLGQYCLWIIGPHSPLKFIVKMACAFGMILASVLNGFGCASLPHSNLAGMYLKPVSARVLAKVEEDYFYAARKLEEKKYMLSGMLRLSCSANVPADNIKIKQLKEEINFLEHLVADMNEDIDEMKYSQKIALKARTTAGRISWVLGVVFSVVLVVRVALAASSFVYASSANPPLSQRRDPITLIILWLTGHHIVSDEQYNVYLQGTSLILAGFLSLSQVRNFFRVVGALSRKLTQTFGVSIRIETQKAMGELSLLLCSFTMGCYFISCVVVLKMTLPLEYKAAFSDSLGKFDFGFNSAVLNMIFCTATCTTAVILGFLFGIQRQNSERYSVETISARGSFSQGVAHSA